MKTRKIAIIVGLEKYFSCEKTKKIEDLSYNAFSNINNIKVIALKPKKSYRKIKYLSK
jgi:hypothetical protein